jgi:hypothetical protein|tara:strand:- start:518 stop:1810 length:1293 start_codon:yes stop_codon:yes gene_type:complete
MIQVGASIIDITPPNGIAMAGFAARTEVAKGDHDALTVRALVVDDTAIVTVDVIGIDANLSARARARASLPDQAITITATHTHGGPVSMPGRLSAKADHAFILCLEDAVVKAVDLAIVNQKPARLLGGIGVEPGFATNRRRLDGPVDTGIPILRFESVEGSTIAILVSYACHPVVLGADNLSWTGDYPHFVRKKLETTFPGAIAIFATGCAGDVNTGHSAAASLSLLATPERSFAKAKEIGFGIANSVIDARLTDVSGNVGHSEVFADICFEQREQEAPDILAKSWRLAAKDTSSLEVIWANWAEKHMGRDLSPLKARITALKWGSVGIIALPGEIFAETALEIREKLAQKDPLFILAYADDNPGYIPPESDYLRGGYEIDEAHRFYGLGATIAPKTAEHLAEAGCKSVEMARISAAQTRPTKTYLSQGV